MENRKDDCFRFFIYACLFGIIIPIFLLILYDCYNPTFNHWAVKLILFVIMVIVIYPLIAYILYDKSSIRPEIIDTTLRLAGVITIIFIGITVHYTGGMEKSMLSSYFFFIPSAIAISFDANKSLKLVIPLAFLAVILNLLFEANSKLFENTVYLFFYIPGIAFQFLAIYKLETTKNNLS